MAEIKTVPHSEPPSRRAIVGLFCVALAFHAWGAGVGWKSLNLPGCEFRQTQTAIAALFIQQEHNFSLAYPTPVLGKPWSIPMEFPLYQWTVVGVSNGTGWSLTSSGRAVSLACFYFGLPAFYLLLGRLGLDWPRRLLVLGLLLTCPLYIFYARSFLIETMSLMFGAWFLLAYVRTVEGRSWPWLVIVTIAGTGCGLVKVTSFIYFLMPAFLWTLWWFRQDWVRPGRERGRALVGRGLWCAAAVAVSFAVSVWWVQYSDAIKGVSVTGKFLRSGAMAPYHFGTGVRFSAEIWRQHWHILFHDLTTVPVLAGCGILGLIFARRWWALILILVSTFFVVQLIFPILYAWHEYYYVTNAFALMMAFGLVLCGLFDSRLPRPAVWLLVLAVYGLQMWGYLDYYYPGQKQYSSGGSDLTRALRKVTAPGEVLIIAGDDWSSITPYFTERRAFMIRSHLEKTWDTIIPAFKNLKGESVTALIVHGEQVNNQTLIELASTYFNLDPRPAFQWLDAQVYLHKTIWASAGPLVKDIPNIRLLGVKPDEPDLQLKHEILTAGALPRYLENLALTSPAPFKYYTTYGLHLVDHLGRKFLGAHPDTRLWFKLAAGKHTLSTEVDLEPAAYDEKLPPGDRSDGVEILLEEETADGQRHALFSRLLNPRDHPADRGVQPIEHAFELAHDGVVVLSVGPGPKGSYARDWALLGGIKIK